MWYDDLIWACGGCKSCFFEVSKGENDEIIFNGCINSDVVDEVERHLLSYLNKKAKVLRHIEIALTPRRWIVAMCF